jgi:hypothetical protein
MSHALAARIVRRLDQQALRGIAASCAPRPIDLDAEWHPEREALAIRHRVHDDFGLTTFGEHSIGDLKDLLASGDARITRLGKAFGGASAAWAGRDPGGFADFSNDYLRLLARWGAAKAAAQAKIASFESLSSGGFLMPSPPDAAHTAAQSEYNGLLRALKQGAPPDGAPIQKGDYDDLAQRLAKGGGKMDPSPLPQPVSKDAGAAFYTRTAPADLLAMATGQEKPQGPVKDVVDPLLELYAFWKKYKLEILVGGAVLGGLMLLGMVFGAAKAAPLVLKASTGGVL